MNERSCKLGPKVKLKLSEQGYDILKDELTKNENTFSKTTNVMLAFDLMAKGEEITSTQVTKAHLANIIMILCNKLKWNEEPEEQIDIENEVKIINSILLYIFHYL